LAINAGRVAVQAVVDAATVALGGAMIADSLTSNNTPPIPGISPSADPTTGTGTRQWDKPGNFDDANKDFDNYPDITGIDNKGDGVRVGTLPKGGHNRVVFVVID
jgi:hypothetical protein